MIGLVLVAHQPLAAALGEGIQHVFGDQTALVLRDIRPDEDCSMAIRQLAADIAAVDSGQGVLVLTDVQGATPTNIACEAVRDAMSAGHAATVLSGTNLPMLLRVVNQRLREPGLDLAELAQRALEGGRDGVVLIHFSSNGQ